MSRPRVRLRWGVLPELALLALGLVVLAGLGSCLAGCAGTSAYRAQYTAIDAAAELTAGASEVVYAATAADIHEDCASTLDPAAFQLCAQSVGESWRPAQTAIGSLRLGLGTWYEGTRIAEVHGASLGDLVLQGAALFVRTYAEVTDFVAAHGRELPEVPDFILAAARGLGGE